MINNPQFCSHGFPGFVRCQFLLYFMFSQYSFNKWLQNTPDGFCPWQLRQHQTCSICYTSRILQMSRDEQQSRFEGDTSKIWTVIYHPPIKRKVNSLTQFVKYVSDPFSALLVNNGAGQFQSTHFSGHRKNWITPFQDLPVQYKDETPTGLEVLRWYPQWSRQDIDPCFCT